MIEIYTSDKLQDLRDSTFSNLGQHYYMMNKLNDSDENLKMRWNNILQSKLDKADKYNTATVFYIDYTNGYNINTDKTDVVCILCDSEEEQNTMMHLVDHALLFDYALNNNSIFLFIDSYSQKTEKVITLFKTYVEIV